MKESEIPRVNKIFPRKLWRFVSLLLLILSPALYLLLTLVSIVDKTTVELVRAYHNSDILYLVSKDLKDMPLVKVIKVHSEILFKGLKNDS